MDMRPTLKRTLPKVVLEEQERSDAYSVYVVQVLPRPIEWEWRGSMASHGWTGCYSLAH